MTRSSALLLPGVTFVVLWEKLGLGELPRALFLPSPGRTVDERAHIEHAVAVELTRAGFGAGGAADHDLVRTLRLLAKPAYEYYGWAIPAAGPAFSVLAATNGQQAVLAKLIGTAVELRPADPGHPAMAVAAELPEVPPGTGPVTLPSHSLAAFEHATGAKVTGHGQLFAARRDRLGRRWQFPHAIEYVDTTHGRWLLRRATDGGPTSALLGVAEVVAAELDHAARRCSGR
ncbi:ESX secretion-associated protein EspG [Actinocrispum sp. NPDC049592]|uniref:ESX secretion-associated protein EspG n=1 Tax=Actinocrispum sp. NPDC049592 TaxID=3154835 RepID=UPI003413307D